MNHSRHAALRIALTYALVGGIWIVGSDRLLLTLVGVGAPEGITHFQTLKGLAFIGLTATLVFVLASRALKAQERLDQANRERDARYREIFEKARSVIMLIDVATGVVMDANPAAVGFYGWTREQLIGKRVWEISTRSEAEVSATIAEASQERRNVFAVEHRLASGEIRDVEVRSSPIEIDGRRCLFSVVHDITDRLRAEARLAASEAKYRRLLEEASDAIFVLRVDGTILETSRSAEELTGYCGGELLKRRFQSLIPPEDLEAVPLKTEDILAGRFELEERHMRRKDGGLVQVEIGARRTEQGDLQLVVRNITERRALEARLRQAQKLEAVSQLSGGIAHELNNLLTVILANSEMIGGVLTVEQQEARSQLGDLQDAIQRASLLIQRLLRFSRRSELSIQTVDLAAKVGAMLEPLKLLLPESVAVSLVNDGSSLNVRADSAAIEQMLINLVTNARDAMPGGGHLRLETRRARPEELPATAAPGDYACLVVTDDGTGMNEATRSRAFDPFFTTKPPGAGSGLGLAMIYGLTQQQRGFVELTSELGRGTSARLFLPLAIAAQPADAQPEPAATGGTEWILLVEDEAGLRRVAKRALERLGYTVVLAENGEEALGLFREHGNQIALVVTDVVMPKVSGIALYKTLRGQGHTVPFLFTSGYSAEEIEPGNLPEAEMVLLQKPWSLNDLTSTVRSVLDAAPTRQS